MLHEPPTIQETPHTTRDRPASGRAGSSVLATIASVSERRGWAHLLLLPSLLLVAAVVVYPVGSGILISFRRMQINRPRLGTPFIGLDNYRALLEDDVFVTAAKNTLVWVVGGAASQFLVGMIAALALNRALPGFRLARILILLPWLLPSVVAAHMWALMLDARLGIINDLLVKLHLIDGYVAWFADPDWAMPSVLLAELWRWFPFFTLFLLAGLSGIPQELYDAAALDGASYRRQFFDVTLPLLQPVIVASVVLRVISLVNSPDLLVVLTNGGPGYKTQVLSLYAFQMAYNAFNFGYAAALSVVLLLVLIVFTGVYVRVTKVTQE
ncbi:MAG: carbohydrate ABC transporter permease [Thermomicrobiales bacterium]